MGGLESLGGSGPDPQDWLPFGYCRPSLARLDCLLTFAVEIFETWVATGTDPVDMSSASRAVDVVARPGHKECCRIQSFVQRFPCWRSPSMSRLGALAPCTVVTSCAAQPHVQEVTLAAPPGGAIGVCLAPQPEHQLRPDSSGGDAQAAGCSWLRSVLPSAHTFSLVCGSIPTCVAASPGCPFSFGSILHSHVREFSASTDFCDMPERLGAAGSKETPGQWVWRGTADQEYRTQMARHKGQVDLPC